MKYLKQYEFFEDEPQIGDYVLCDIKLERHNERENIMNFVNNNIGQIINIQDTEIRVQYTNVPKEIKNWFRQDTISFNGKEYDKYSKLIHSDKIIAIGKTPEEVKIKIDANKYNL